MSSPEQETPEVQQETAQQEQQTPAPQAPEAPQRQPGETQDEFRVRREDWETVVGALRGLYAERQQPEDEGEEFDYDNADISELIQHYVDGRLGEIQPYVTAAAERQGKDQMNSIFDRLEKDPEVGSFDRDVAEKLSQSIFASYGGDPRMASQAVTEGAKLAAQIRREEREAGVNEFKKAAKKTPFTDPAGGGGGERAPKKAETMDDVIDFYENTFGKGAEEV